MHNKYFFWEEIDTVEKEGSMEDFSEEEVGGLCVGDDVMFTPGKDDPLCNDEYQLAGKVAWVNDDGTVNLTVFTAEGETVARKSVTQVKYGDAVPEEGHFCQDSYFAIIDQEDDFDDDLHGYDSDDEDEQ